LFALGRVLFKPFFTLAQFSEKRRVSHRN
jgi:hypothetical protein